MTLATTHKMSQIEDIIMNINYCLGGGNSGIELILTVDRPTFKDFKVFVEDMISGSFIIGVPSNQFNNEEPIQLRTASGALIKIILKEEKHVKSSDVQEAH